MHRHCRRGIGCRQIDSHIKSTSQPIHHARHRMATEDFVGPLPPKAHGGRAIRQRCLAGCGLPPILRGTPSAAVPYRVPPTLDASGRLSKETPMKLVRMGLALSFVLWTNSALAWNGRGHMIVAAVAWTHMTPASQARAAALLKLNPMYATWISGVPAAKQDQVAFVVAATWPDIIKHTTGYTNDGEKPINPGASQNI